MRSLDGSTWLSVTVSSDRIHASRSCRDRRRVRRSVDVEPSPKVPGVNSSANPSRPAPENRTMNGAVPEDRRGRGHRHRWLICGDHDGDRAGSVIPLASRDGERRDDRSPVMGRDDSDCCAVRRTSRYASSRSDPALGTPTSRRAWQTRMALSGGGRLARSRSASHSPATGLVRVHRPCAVTEALPVRVGGAGLVGPQQARPPRQHHRPGRVGSPSSLTTVKVTSG